MNTEIKDAIINMAILELNYDGYARIVEPHVYGITKDGEELLKCYQIEGQDKVDAGWHLVCVSEIKDLTITDESFLIPRENYSGGTDSMKRIYAAL